MKKILFLLLALLTLAGTQAQTIRDSRNAMIGKVETNGTIRDSRNAMIGTAPGVAPRVAAVLFFMNLLILR